MLTQEAMSQEVSEGTEGIGCACSGCEDLKSQGVVMLCLGSPEELCIHMSGDQVVRHCM
jgi:hypothetical protein